MELWGLLIGYVALFALLHVVLYYVYRNRDEDERSPSRAFTEQASTNYAPFEHAGAVETDTDTDTDDPNAAFNFEPAGETVTCPHCGASNEADQTYTYCWNCISPVRQ